MDQNAPVLVSGLVATQIVAGDRHTCALRTTGEVACWGDNSFGQLGDGTITNRSTSGPVPGLINAAAIDTGGGHTCALPQTGVLSCWGDNSSGQLGDGSTTNSLVPTDVLWP